MSPLLWFLEYTHSSSDEHELALNAPVDGHFQQGDMHSNECPSTLCFFIHLYADHSIIHPRGLTPQFIKAQQQTFHKTSYQILHSQF